MGVKLRRWANDHRLYLWLLGILFLALESTAHLFGDTSHWGEFLRHLGLVAILAGLSSFVVDKYLKKELSEEIARDVARQVYVYGLPKEVVDEVDWARSLGVVRVGTKMHFAFHPYTPKGATQPDPALVSLTTTVKFSLENRTDTDFAFTHRCTIRDPLVPLDGDPFDLFECSQANDVVDSGYQLYKNGLSPHLNAGSDWEIAKSVRIRPNKGNVRHTFIHKCRTVYRIEGQELFTFQQPTVGCEITIDAKPMGLRVTPIFLHRAGKTEVTAIPQENPTEFKLGHAFLGPAVLTLIWKRP